MGLHTRKRARTRGVLPRVARGLVRKRGWLPSSRGRDAQSGRDLQAPRRRPGARWAHAARRGAQGWRAGRIAPQGRRPLGDRRRAAARAAPRVANRGAGVPPPSPEVRAGSRTGDGAAARGHGRARPPRTASARVRAGGRVRAGDGRAPGPNGARARGAIRSKATRRRRCGPAPPGGAPGDRRPDLRDPADRRPRWGRAGRCPGPFRARRRGGRRSVRPAVRPGLPPRAARDFSSMRERRGDRPPFRRAEVAVLTPRPAPPRPGPPASPRSAPRAAPASAPAPARSRSASACRPRPRGWSRRRGCRR